MKANFFLATLLLGPVVFAQPSLDWAISMGNSSYDYVHQVEVDNNGNVFSVGNLQGVVDFDPGTNQTNLTSNGDTDVFIQKLDANGDFLWAKSIGGTGTDTGVTIDSDINGNIYVAGSFSGTIDLDPGIGNLNVTSTGFSDFFVLKLDPNGNLVWAKNFGGIGTLNSLKLDEFGNVFLTGVFIGTSDFDPGTDVLNLTSNGTAYDVFIQKLDSNGDLVWAKSFGGSQSEEASELDVDSNGNVHVIGSFSGVVDFNPSGGNSISSLGQPDIYVVKFDNNGDFIWAKTSGGTGSLAKGYGVAVGLDGSIYCTGFFTGTIDFDPSSGTVNLTSNGSGDCFIQKLDSLGNLIWVHSFGGVSPDQGRSVSIDDNGDVYLTGSYSGTVDFNPSTTSEEFTSIGGYDVFIQKFDALGNLTWVTTFGGSDQDVGISIDVDATGAVHTAGYFSDVLDFDPGNGVSNLTPNGGYDCFVQKLLQCQPDSTIETEVTCGTYFWNGNSYNSSGVYSFSTTNIQGCDSTVILNLTIDNSPLDVGVTQLNDSTLSADASGYSYQWIDCNNGNSPIMGETNQSYIVNTSGNYAVIVVNGTCSDTSDCFNLSVANLESLSQQIDLIQVFPNPVLDKIQVSGLKNPENFKIYSAWGELIQAGKTDSEINLSSVCNGVYFLKFENRPMLKLVKKK